MTKLAERKEAGALILPFFEGKRPAFSEEDFTSFLAGPLATEDFQGKAEQVLTLYPSQAKEKRIVLVGLGKEEALSKEVVRRSYACATVAVKERVDSVNVLLPKTGQLDKNELSHAVVEGTLLANYVFDAFKSEKDKAISHFAFIGGEKEAIEKSYKICKGVCFARELVINNADVVTPAFLGEMAQELSANFGPIKTTVFGPKEIAKENLQLLEAVARGASEEARFIVIEYKGASQSKKTLALVGKGITYDTGGLNIKPTGGMETMRDDMSGAGALLGTLHAVASLELPINVVVCIASTENAIGPKSYKPGDVYGSHQGLHVEISNTDAEGRLVLADALSYVQTHFHPDWIVDIATLTGGAIVALGEEVSCLMGNDEALASALIQAGEETYERLWPLPLHKEYGELLKSKVADIKNSGPRKASPIQGGIFLQRFIRETKWAHIDIAGTAFPESLKPYQPVQATGVGVRLLTQFIESLIDATH
jgi:leucyl aminopeptidase